MSEEIRSRLEQELQSHYGDTTPSPARLDEVLRGGRRRKLEKRVLIGALSLISLIVGVAGIGSVTWPDGDRIESASTLRGAPQPDLEASVTDRAATFAIRATAEAGLLETDGALYDYRGVKEVEIGGWEASFGAYDCEKNVSEGRCESLGPARLLVVKEDGRFSISDASGPLLTDSKRQTLLQFQRPDDRLEAGFEFLDVSVVKYPDVTALQGSATWIGPIPIDDGYVSDCHGTVLNEGGDVVFSGGSLTLSPPLSEDLRSGALHPIDVPSNAVSEPGHQAMIVCDLIRTTGWEPLNDPVIDRAGSTGSSVLVDLTLVWRGGPTQDLRSECTISVEDGEGAFMGDAVFKLLGPENDPDGEAREDLSLSVSVTEPSLADRAVVSCALIRA